MLQYDEPDRLYSIEDLLQGYDEKDPMAFAKSWDFRTYGTYVADGGATPKTLDIRIAQAGHDARIAEALKIFLDRPSAPKLVGIMGGHGLSRSTTGAYAAVARLAKHLTREGYLIVTGGGPGAMEAGHLGATFSGATDNALEHALAALATIPRLPDKMDTIVAPDGAPVAGSEDVFDDARLWLNQALQVLHSVPELARGESLAIPTWHYGSEPSTPFASAYAKYFQNSIREEALITKSRAGIIYAQGAGGTLREIFEDVEQNFYAKTAAAFTPMIFFDPDGFWQHDAKFDKDGKVISPGLNVYDLVEKVFRFGRKDSAEVLKKIRFTVDLAEIDEVVGAHAPAAQLSLAFSLASA